MLLTAFFGAMLVAFQVAMDLLVLGAAAIVSITLLTLAMGNGMLVFPRYLARGCARDQADLESGEVWAE